MTIDELNDIRAFIVENIMRNPDIMFNDTLRGGTGYDLIEIIASLYEKLHREVTGEPYEYMFHWANKIGSWVEDDFFDNKEWEDEELLDDDLEDQFEKILEDIDAGRR